MEIRMTGGKHIEKYLEKLGLIVPLDCVEIVITIGLSSEINYHCGISDEMINKIMDQAANKAKTYHPGHKFKMLGTEWILASVGDSSCCLIGLEGGCRSTDPVKVHSLSKVTNDELDQMSSNHNWELITERKDNG